MSIQYKSLPRTKFQKWLGYVLGHDEMLCNISEGKMLAKKTIGRRWIQMVDDLIGNSIYTDMKKAAEDGSVWRTQGRDGHKASE